MTRKKKPASKPVSRDRVVYEVKGPQGIKQVNATSTAELKNLISPLLGLDPYSIQAAAHLAHVERAVVTGSGWSIKRLGVLAFVPDAEQQPQRRKTDQGQEQPAEQPQASQEATAPTADTQPQQESEEEQTTQEKLPDDSENY